MRLIPSLLLSLAALCLGSVTPAATLERDPDMHHGAGSGLRLYHMPLVARDFPIAQFYDSVSPYLRGEIGNRREDFGYRLAFVRGVGAGFDTEW